MNTLKQMPKILLRYMQPNGFREVIYNGKTTLQARHLTTPGIYPETHEIKVADPVQQDVFKEVLKQPDYFHVAELFTVEDLFKANVHLGHREGTLNNYMRPYLFGSRLGHLIFDLDLTASLLRDALNFTAHIAFQGGIILFICRGAQYQLLVEKTAADCKEFAHTREWHLQTFTDSSRFFGSVTRLPDLVIFLSTMISSIEQHIAVLDSTKLLIPTVGIVDSNCDPRLITYPVPGNDDTYSAMNIYCKLFKNAILKAKQKREIVFADNKEDLLA